jgi:hypothetical protein
LPRFEVGRSPARQKADQGNDGSVDNVDHGCENPRSIERLAYSARARRNDGPGRVRCVFATPLGQPCAYSRRGANVVTGLPQSEPYSGSAGANAPRAARGFRRAR